MAYTKHTVVQYLIALGAIFGIAAAFWSVSGTYDTEVVQGFDAPAREYTVSQDKPLLLQLPYSEKQIAGVIVYAASDSSLIQGLRASIQDEHGNILAKKRFQHVQYKQDEDGAIYVYFERKNFTKDQRIFLSLMPYGKNSLALTATPDQKIVYSLLHKEPVSPSTKQGVLVGSALAVSFLLLYQLRISPKKQWLLAGMIIIGCSIMATLPYTYRTGDLGIFDWDYRHSLSHIYQTTIREYHQFPLWNPYICGGTAALGDPEFAVFTPSFLAQSLFGVETGTAIALSLSFTIAGLGALLLAASLKLDPFSALLSCVIILFSSSLMLKATEGHTTILFAFMWVPWALWAWLHAYRLGENRRQSWVFSCGIFLGLAVLQGGIYILSYTAVAFVVLALLSRNKAHAMRISVYSLLWMAGLTSFQLIPSLMWVKEFPDQAFVGSAYTYKNLWDIFFGRYLQNVFVLPNQLSRWHEYGAYIGYGVFALVLVGISYVKSSRIVRVLLFGVLATLVVSSLGPLFEPILIYLKFLPRSNISRLVLFTVLCAGLLAGFGMKRLISHFPRSLSIIPVIIAGFIAIDLLSMAYPIAEEGFLISRESEHIPKSPYPITYTTDTFDIRHNGSDIPRAYSATLKGYGTFSFCSVIGPAPAVTLASDIHNPPAFIQSEQIVQTKLLDWSPNKIIFSYTSPQDTQISINANYASGWRTNYGSIVPNNPHLTVQVPAGEKTVTLHYRPPGMIFGLLVSIATLLLSIQRKHVFG